ncbi:MAG: preprotein translocase subunit SecG [Candidatus Omnitrophica bacterium]|nr:preprotein translocase subunit SecG [Candidatus Omnitrophota bacterium]
MYAVIIVVHVIASLFLIAVILLQAGRGGGLADSVGSSQMQNLFGTKSTTVLTKLTTACASIFIITCITIAIISSYKSKSLVEKINIPEMADKIDLGGNVTEEEEQGPVFPKETEDVVEPAKEPEAVKPVEE